MSASKNSKARVPDFSHTPHVLSPPITPMVCISLQYPEAVRKQTWQLPPRPAASQFGHSQQTSSWEVQWLGYCIYCLYLYLIIMARS